MEILIVEVVVPLMVVVVVMLAVVVVVVMDMLTMILWILLLLILKISMVDMFRPGDGIHTSRKIIWHTAHARHTRRILSEYS